MQLVSIVVILVAGAFIWTRRPVAGLCAYLAVLCLYPQYVGVSIGNVDWTTARTVILILVIRIISQPIDPGLLRFRWLDLWVLAAFFGQMMAHFAMEPMFTVVEREGGRFFDTVMVYIAVRFSIRDWSDLRLPIKTLVYCGIFLAAVGAYQSLTGFNMYSFARAYSPWEIGEQEMRVRYGLYRADASFGNKIPFGLFFTLVLALHVSTYYHGRRRSYVFVLQAIALIVGLLSSMSSAPIFALVVTLGCIAVYPMRRYWPYFALIAGGTVLAAELYSDAHFYDALARFAFSGRNASYRIELVEEALGGGMSGHWLFGYGYVHFLNEGHNGWYWRHTDLVNIYIAILARAGLVGLLPYLALNATYYWSLFRAGRSTTDVNERWIIWCVASGLVAWNIAMMTVSALEQTAQLLYAGIGICGALRYVAVQSSDLAHHDVPEPAVEPPPGEPGFRPSESPFRRLQSMGSRDRGGRI